MAVRLAIAAIGALTAIGDFKPTRDPSLGAATSAFGQPSSRRGRGSGCTLGWRAIGLRIIFANFGGGSACDPSLGRAQTVSAFGRSWRTSKGLKIGDGVSKLRRLYPRAFWRGSAYRLVGARSQFGGPGRYSVLAAKTNAKRVGSFKLFVGAAGE